MKLDGDYFGFAKNACPGLLLIVLDLESYQLVKQLPFW